MSVKIGSARIDENGKAKGGKAGDQTGREVSTQSWYDRKEAKKAWRVFRAKDPAVAERIAQDMQWACDNPHIGYDQGQRLTLYNVAKPLGFNCAKVATNCETDCSALVRVCCAYAGVMLPNFRTTTEASVLLNSGAFEEMKGDKYSHSSAYLRRGDILVTSIQGHTVVVLTNGPKADAEPPVPVKLGDRVLEKGCKGEDVSELQHDLLKMGYKLPRYGADGDFGTETQDAVKAFQTGHGLPADGVMDSTDYTALFAALDGQTVEPGTEPPAPAPAARLVEITGDTVNVRAAPGTKGKDIGDAHKGEKYQYGGQTAEVDGRDWYLIDWHNQNGWVSSKFARLV